MTSQAGLGRREFLTGLAGAAALGGGPAWPARALAAPAAGAAAVAPVAAFGCEVAATWFSQALALVRSTPGFSPPVASRALAYAGVTLYEALAPGMPAYRSLAGLLEGLTPPPGPADPAYHWPTVANSAMAAILRLLFPLTPANAAVVDALEAGLAAQLQAGVPPGRRRRSIERGHAVADHVFEWSQADGGHEGYLHNFPPYAPPVGPGLWVPTPPGFLSALQPFWGATRPFVLASGAACAPAPPLPYSTDPGSPFYAEAFSVYATVNALTPDQRAIARFWSDAPPDSTVSPPGHSVSILTQVLVGLGASLEAAAEAYARVGMAVGDAFIACWDTKFRHNLLRPVTYIRAVIDPTWTPVLVTPPFPEYTSGHSVQSAAAAEVLAALFGDVTFTDHTHDASGLAPRAFGSFWGAANEAAISRLYGGIHFLWAIAQGLDQGRCIGQAVTALPMRRSP